MKTRALALAVLFCSGAALAQDPLGDDSGPNANDGQCDDTRFENIGAGNSNIVFWEGGRYDGRDATDCRNLLLQGLINWRDGVDPRVDIVLATGDFGDDSGPNANDGQCDDTRFENIGAGNSNIVYWEGGRYDGRDATDCADLLLQGLIAWRRDTAVAEVPVESETPAVAEARQQQATLIAPARPSGPLCTDTADEPCWMELDSLPDCYVWVLYPQEGLEIDSWSGRCSNGLGTGTVVYGINGDEGTKESPYVNGVLHGTMIRRFADGGATDTPYVNGVLHGTMIRREANGDVHETPWVNGELHGTLISRYADGEVWETPYVNGVMHGIGKIWDVTGQDYFTYQLWVNDEIVDSCFSFEEGCPWERDL